MKHKYQSSLSKRLVASGLAAVFSAGAFSSYVGAMNEQLLDPEMENKKEIKMPTGGAEVTIGGGTYIFANIPSDQISENFNKYIEKDYEGVKEAVELLGFLDSFCAEGYNAEFDIDFFLDNVLFTSENTERRVSLKEIFKDENIGSQKLIKDFPKTFDILYFVVKDWSKYDNIEDLKVEDFRLYLINDCVYDEIIIGHFKTFYNKVKPAIEAHFEPIIKEERQKEERKNFLMLFFVAALFSAGSMVVYNYFNINKQEDKDSSKKEPIHKDQNSTGKIQNPAGENKDSKDQTQKAVDEKQKSTGKTQNPEGENNKSTGKTQKAADEKQKSTGKTQNSAGESNKSTSKAQEAAGENENSKGEIQTAADEKQKFTDKTQSTVIENNKSTNVTQEYTHEDREHENWGNTTNDSNKYPKTDNGFGSKNLKVILPVVLGSTAAVGSNVAAGVIKHFSNKNRQK